MNDAALRKFFDLEPRDPDALMDAADALGELWCPDCACLTNHRGPHPEADEC